MASYYTQLDEDRGAETEFSEWGRDQEVHRMVDARSSAKNASAGATIECPVCKHKFIKRASQQAFCSNQYKKRNGLNCKDRYNNIVNPRGIYARWYDKNGGEAA